MTSSLVGSEMCIRDRLWSARAVQLGRRSNARGQRGPFRIERGMPINNPVSYTHLTLPTICSV
eukprot:134884-Prorocentrum_lima.AAC.1